MATSIVRYQSEVVIGRPIDEVFDRLADLSAYQGWMHRSGLFRHCDVTSGDQTAAGTTYADATRMGTFHGEVTDFERPTRIAFRETLRWFGRPMSQARPEFDLEANGTSTVVRHVAEGELYGPMRLMKPGAALMARMERGRTLRSLQRSFRSDKTWP